MKAKYQSPKVLILQVDDEPFLAGTGGQSIKTNLDGLGGSVIEEDPNNAGAKYEDMDIWE
ncbi:MAG: hypothetical protein SOX84_00715 [Prevotella sp.]|nr:hypothetical protein [Prevotella sp.]MDY4217302.1 hypothetical protein [Prevotella sp.]